MEVHSSASLFKGCLLSKTLWVNWFHTTAGFWIAELHINLMVVWREETQRVSVWYCICVLSDWVHLLLWKKDDGSKKWMSTVSMDWFSCVCVGVCVSVCPSLLEATGNWRTGEPQINFLFIVAEWRLEMHGLLWPRFIPPFSFCYFSLAQWHNIRSRDRRRVRDERKRELERGKEGSRGTVSWIGADNEKDRKSESTGVTDRTMWVLHLRVESCAGKYHFRCPACGIKIWELTEGYSTQRRGYGEMRKEKKSKVSDRGRRVDEKKDELKSREKGDRATSPRREGL